MDYLKNIEYYLTLRGMNKAELYRKSGVQKGTFINAANNNSFSTKMLEKLAKALNVSVADLVKNRNEDTQKEALKDIHAIKKKLDDFEQKHLK